MILGTDFYYIVDKRYCIAIALINWGEDPLLCSESLYFKGSYFCKSLLCYSSLMQVCFLI